MESPYATAYLAVFPRYGGSLVQFSPSTGVPLFNAFVEGELALFVESVVPLSSQLYASVSDFSSLKVSVMSEQ